MKKKALADTQISILSNDVRTKKKEWYTYVKKEKKKGKFTCMILAKYHISNARERLKSNILE